MMQTYNKFIVNAAELTVSLFGLAVVSSVLFGFDLIGPMLTWLSTTKNTLLVLSLAFLYIVNQAALDD